MKFDGGGGDCDDETEEDISSGEDVLRVEVMVVILRNS